MKQQNKQPHLTKYLSIFALLICIAIAKTSCKKIDELSKDAVTNNTVNTNQFFNLPANVNSAVARVALELKLQNELTGFVNEIANTAGYPVWDKSVVKLIKQNNIAMSASLSKDGEGGDTCILVPMVLQDAKYVNAFIAASIIDDSVTMRMFYRNDYKAYPFKASQPAAGVTTAEAFASQMLLFDNEVFGYNTFQVLDKRLFHTSTNYSDTAAAKIEIKINESQPGNGGNNLIYVTKLHIQ
jgi:hypothetical protein